MLLADKAAAPPVNTDEDEVPVDENGDPLPKSWRPATTRGEQLHDALRVIAETYLAGEANGADEVGSTAPAARPTMMVVCDVKDLVSNPHSPVVRAVSKDLKRDVAGGGSAPMHDVVDPRTIWRFAGARKLSSRARILQLSCDANRIPVLTDGNTILAIGDQHDPIGTALRRAIHLRDLQSQATARRSFASAHRYCCRAVAQQLRAEALLRPIPHCNAPGSHCDIHHIQHREHGGKTDMTNLVSLCLPDRAVAQQLRAEACFGQRPKHETQFGH